MNKLNFLNGLPVRFIINQKLTRAPEYPHPTTHTEKQMIPYNKDEIFSTLEEISYNHRMNTNFWAVCETFKIFETIANVTNFSLYLHLDLNNHKARVGFLPLSKNEIVQKKLYNLKDLVVFPDRLESALMFIARAKDNGTPIENIENFLYLYRFINTFNIAPSSTCLKDSFLNFFLETNSLAQVREGRERLIFNDDTSHSFIVDSSNWSSDVATLMGGEHYYSVYEKSKLESEIPPGQSAQRSISKV